MPLRMIKLVTSQPRAIAAEKRVPRISGTKVAGET